MKKTAPLLFTLGLFTVLSSSSFSQSVVAKNYVPMVRTDRVWEYHVAPAYYPTHTYYSMQFEGSITALGNTYDAFVVKKATVFTGYGDDETVSEDTFTDNGDKFFVREEEGKVFTLFSKVNEEDGEIFSSKLPVDQIKFSEEQEGALFEIKMYDSNEANGAVLNLPEISEGYYQSNSTFPVQQFHGESLDIEGQNCRLFGFYSCNPDSPAEYEYPTLANDHGMFGWIEGIGVLRQGFLPVYQIKMKTGAPAMLSGVRSDDTWLQGVYTLDGEVLFGKPSVCNGIKRINDDASPADSRMFDVMGREITSPAPGTVYIQGCKKLIAK